MASKTLTSTSLQVTRFSTVILLLLSYICTAALVQTEENGKRPGLWLLGNPAPHEMLPSHHCLVWIGNQTEQEQAAMYSKLCRNFPVPPSRTFIDPVRVRNRAAPPAADPSCKLLGHYKALLAKTTRFKLVSSPPGGSPRSRPLVHPALLCNIALSNVYVNMYIDLSIFTAFPFLCMSRTERQITTRCVLGMQ